MMGHKQHVSAKVIEQGEGNHTEHSDTSSAIDHVNHSNITGDMQHEKDAKTSTQQPVYRGQCLYTGRA